MIFVFCTQNPFPMIAGENGMQIHLKCYANYDKEIVVRNRKLHSATSPLLIGDVAENDVIKHVVQKLWRNE